jgi:CheY-like chemotaxis protein
MDIEQYDWEFKVQAGALRRVIMNIFGNAQKYTDSGYILIEVGIRKASWDSPRRSTNTPQEVLLIHIRDSGRGMSSEYMERKLYHPFAQEDSFAPGVGLGLSIVQVYPQASLLLRDALFCCVNQGAANFRSWSIINQLGGKINIRSEIGKGTDVEITLPVDRPDGSEAGRLDDLAKISADAQEAVTNLRGRAAGKSVLIARRVLDTGPSRHHDVSWNCIERYCADWYGYHVIKSQEDVNSATADLVITDHNEEWANSNAEIPDGQRVLIVHDQMVCRERHRQAQRPLGTICSPIGPFKLARCLLDLLDQNVSRGSKACNTSDAGTQTPLAEERVPGIPMTDYGFTVPLLGLKIKPEAVLELQTPEETEPEVPKEPHAQPEKEPQASLDSNISPPASKPQDDGVQQVLASLGALSLRMPARLTKRIQTAPLVPTLSNHSAPKPTPARPDPNTPLYILAVDDNALNLQLIHRYLMKRATDTITTARNGVEAIAAVRDAVTKGNYFDVIFMDISMPEMDGFEATRLIRSFERSFAHRSISEEARYFSLGAGNAVAEIEEVEKKDDRGRGRGRRRAYVIALTGLASRRDRDEAESSGFDDFLTKPSKSLSEQSPLVLVTSFTSPMDDADTEIFTVAFGKIGDLLKKLSVEKGGEYRVMSE